MQFDKVEVRDCLKYSRYYLICRFLHILAYVIAMQILSWTYFPLYCSALGTVCQAVAVFLVWRWERESIPRCLTWCSPSLAVGAALVLDAGLIAMTRLDVQHWILSFVPGIGEIVGPEIACDVGFHLGGCQQQLQSNSVSTSQVLLFILSYFVILVLRDSHSLLVSGLCFIVYAAMVLTASCTFEVEFKLTTHIDLWSLVPFLVINVIAKYKITASKRLLMDFVEKQKKNVVQEKVLRCHAEFTCEQMASQFASNQVAGKPSDLDAPAQATPDDGPAVASEMAFSAQTVPASFQRRPQGHTPLCSSRDGDCLPATAVAWVENCPVPLPLKSLLPGQRVLCYDSIGRGLTYAEVTDSHPAEHSAAADWIVATLTNGTQLTMTADHPVTVSPTAGHPLEMRRQCLYAEELQADRDCLMVLEMASVPVASVTRMVVDAAAAPVAGNEWITVTIEQPERHELFVATCNNLGVPGQPIAVGSSDRVPSSVSPSKLQVKNSFIESIHTESFLPRRPSSAPPSLRAGRSEAGPSEAGRQHKSTSEPDTVSTLSEMSNSLSTESLGCQNLAVRIGPPFCNSLKLGDFLHLKSAGVNMGSIHKPENDCRPCSFHFSWLHDPSKRRCKSSYMCEFCHDSTHHACWRSKFRKLRKQTDRRAEFAPSSFRSQKEGETSTSI